MGRIAKVYGISEEGFEELGGMDRDMTLSERELDTILEALSFYVSERSFYAKYPKLQEAQDLQDAEAVLRKVMKIFETMKTERRI